jgi:hypothetical protein
VDADQLRALQRPLKGQYRAAPHAALVTLRGGADLDSRGTLGVDRAAAVGFTAIRLASDLESPAPQEQLDELIATTERYCVVFQTIASPPELAVAPQ